ncbi:MAG TPA: class I SAM-dependent methyltransferase, partial [Gaiellaceae bacterium]|nr:class I SAM-dependent methyltransferase [Gaiellaceae bacterium]
DAYGHLILDFLEGNPRAREIVERDDGFIEATDGPEPYFAPPRRWPSAERRALRWMRGRVLDVGCGAGRVALELQRRGHEVVGIDVSPLAVEVSRRRGVRRAEVCGFDDVDASLGRVDTVVLFGNNFGLFGSRTGARRRFRRLEELGVTRIVASSRDPYGTTDPAHLDYQRRNRERGRLSGHLRLRVRYRQYASPWFDYLIVSPDEMTELADAAGWSLVRVLEGEPLYVGVLEPR